MFQFTTGLPPSEDDEGKILEKSELPTIHFVEEEGAVELTVERAQGWFGHVTCEWRTQDGTAISRQLPKDFEVSIGPHIFCYWAKRLLLYFLESSMLSEAQDDVEEPVVMMKIYSTHRTREIRKL